MSNQAQLVFTTETNEIVEKKEVKAGPTKCDIEDLIKKHEKRRPNEPGPDDCCGTGCDPCVFDVYDNKMEKFEEKMSDLQGKLIELEDSDY